MTTTLHQALAGLGAAQQRLSRLLLAMPQDIPAIIEAGEALRRAELAVLRAERVPG